MTRNYLATALLGFGLLVCGCGTILSGHRDKITISSKPEGATIYVDGQRVGETPKKVTLVSTSDHTVRLEKDGYEPKTATLVRKVAAGYVVLDVVTGVIPLLVDATTKGWKTLRPEGVDVEMTPESKAADSSESQK